ncbi:MAG: hypothetical protein ACI4BB_04995 [Coprococcus sp.]
MKKVLKRVVAVAMAAAMVLSVAACGNASSSSSSNGGSAATATGSGESSLKGKNVRVVIGSTSTSGDSYMIADIVTRYLGAEMGFNGKVDAIGNADALDTISNAKGDGTTIMMFHDMTFLSVLFGSVPDVYALENLTVGPRIGQNPGGCFGAAKEDGFATLADVTDYLVNKKGNLAFNIESGATSHLAFAAYYLYIKDTYGEDVASQIKAIVGGTTAEKLQRLWDRQADIIYGDTSSFEQYTVDGVQDQLAMTMFGSCGEVEGVEIDSMAASGVTFDGEPFDFAKDFAMYFPKDMDEGILAEIEAAMQKVTENPDFQAEMAKLYYNTLSADEVTVAASQEYIYNKREMCSKIIELSPSLDDLAN